MSKVERMIIGKGRIVYTIAPTNTVFEAIAKMVAYNVGSLVVIGEDGSPCGMITERDYLRRVALEGRSSKTTFVQEIMSTGLSIVSPQTEAEDCMSLMTKKRVRHLLVIEDGKLVGIVSIGDIVKHLAREREATIEQLTDYIQGRYA